MRPVLPLPRLQPPQTPACPALPAGPPRYVMPASHTLDPPYAWMTATWPFPRPPWPYETESRAPGTGLLRSFIGLPC